MIKDDELLEKNNKIQNKVSNGIRKGVDSEPACNKKYLNNKMKFYEGKINTNFHEDKIPKEDSCCIFLLIVLELV